MLIYNDFLKNNLADVPGRCRKNYDLLRLFACSEKPVLMYSWSGVSVRGICLLN
jgi:hypothetical protein